MLLAPSPVFRNLRFRAKRPGLQVLVHFLQANKTDTKETEGLKMQLEKKNQEIAQVKV